MRITDSKQIRILGLLLIAVALIITVGPFGSTTKSEEQSVKMVGDYNELTPEEERVIVHKGTERPGSGESNDHKETRT